MANADEAEPYHYEFIFNPYDLRKILIAKANRVVFTGDKPAPEPPRWQIGAKGLAAGNQVPAAALTIPLPRLISKFQWSWCRANALLENCIGTPGQVFSATISYFERTVESAFTVSIVHALPSMEISARLAKDLMVPSICQVRIVHPTRSLFGFTRHSPKTAVFEFAMAKKAQFQRFEKALRTEFAKAGIAYTFHWSKNSGLDRAEIDNMYGKKTVNKWLDARDLVFDRSPNLKRVFDNAHVVRGGLG